jgi:hypothetical protein
MAAYELMEVKTQAHVIVEKETKCSKCGSKFGNVFVPFQYNPVTFEVSHLQCPLKRN